MMQALEEEEEEDVGGGETTSALQSLMIDIISIPLNGCLRCLCSDPTDW